MKDWKRRACMLLAAIAQAGGAAGVTHALDRRAYMGQAQAVETAATTAQDPLAEFETGRQQLRARRKSQLNALLHDSATDGDTLIAARQKLLEDMDEERQEETLQGILRARGFDGAVVSVRSGAANILVRSQGLNRQETAVILELVMRETGITGGNVKIIPIN